MSFCFIALAIAAAAVPTNSAVVANLTILYETLCPFSQKLLRSEGLADVIDFFDADPEVIISLVPFGFETKLHAKPNQSEQWKCQHGPRECKYNRWHTCATVYLPGSTNAARYAACTVRDRKKISFRLRQCTTEEIAKQLDACAEGEQGLELMSDMEGRTHSTNLKGGVPVVLLNGVKISHSKPLVDRLCKLQKPPSRCGTWTAVD